MHQPNTTALIALKKAHSHLGRVIDMVEDDQYCIDIMQQNLAVLGLLRSAHQTLLEGHLNHCFTAAIQSNSSSKKKDMVEEILQVTKLANK